MQLVGCSKKMGEQDFTRSTHLQCIHSKLLTWNIVASTFSYNNRCSFQKQMVPCSDWSANQTTNFKGKDL